MLEYDNVLNKQREVIYAQRREVLESDKLSGIVQGMMDRSIGLGFELFWAPGVSQAEVDFAGLESYLREMLPEADFTAVFEQAGSRKELLGSVTQIFHEAYKQAKTWVNTCRKSSA